MRRFLSVVPALLIAVAIGSVAWGQNANSSTTNTNSAAIKARTNSNKNRNQNSNSSTTHSNSNSNTSRRHALIDINSASKEQLVGISGIGDVYAQKIIDGRPYKMKSDLVKRGIIPQSVYNKISSQIIAHQPGKK